jgi:hypothetical protein
MQTSVENAGRRALPVILVIAALTLASCTIGPLRISIAGQATPQPPITLRWCDQARDVLCVLSFELEPPHQLVIVLLASPGLPADLEAHATWNGETGAYPCHASLADSTILDCTGPLIPLGSSVRIEVSTADGNAPLGVGDFVLNGLALPTFAAETDPLRTDAATVTPRPTRQSSTSTPEPTRAPATSTHRVVPPRVPGTPYPNPTP